MKPDPKPKRLRPGLDFNLWPPPPLSPLGPDNLAGVAKECVGSFCDHPECKRARKLFGTLIMFGRGAYEYERSRKP